jgi:hypothetical protein
MLTPAVYIQHVARNFHHCYYISLSNTSYMNGLCSGHLCVHCSRLGLSLSAVLCAQGNIS